MHIRLSRETSTTLMPAAPLSRRNSLLPLDKEMMRTAREAASVKTVSPVMFRQVSTQPAPLLQLRVISLATGVGAALPAGTGTAAGPGAATWAEADMGASPSSSAASSSEDGMDRARRMARLRERNDKSPIATQTPCQRKGGAPPCESAPKRQPPSGLPVTALPEVRHGRRL
ncbi:hypothetical protein Hsero_1583 [Herbaspirillum seropedicae SmR1]|uniref:Uncharacterized protein n=1 Tax=Herbaspirillum seropedicae (strain SmR1) TaxID=757424 RepID=D8IQ50_HERSS|nr:hypothetical protein Hsero_1583 [Herbaspirillum seropedicae SmR1]